MKYNLKTVNAHQTFTALVKEQSERGGKTLRASTNNKGVTTLYTTSKISMHGLLEKLGFTAAVQRKKELHDQGLESLKKLARAAYPKLPNADFEKIFMGNQQQTSPASGRYFIASDLNKLMEELDKKEFEVARALMVEEEVTDHAINTASEDLKKTEEYKRLNRAAKDSANNSHTESQRAEAQAALKDIEKQKAQQTKQLIEEFMKSKAPHNSGKTLSLNLSFNLYSTANNPTLQLVEALNNCHDKKDAGERAITILSLAGLTEYAFKDEPGLYPSQGIKLVSYWTPAHSVFWEHIKSPGLDQKGTELGRHFQDYIKKLSPNDIASSETFRYYFLKICEKYPEEVKAAAILTGKNFLLEKSSNLNLNISRSDLFEIYKEQNTYFYSNKKTYSSVITPFISELMWQIACKANDIKMPEELMEHAY